MIEQAWKILNTKFGDQRKLMDTPLTEITNLLPVKVQLEIALSLSG